MKKRVFKILITFTMLFLVMLFLKSIYATEMEEVKENVKLDDVEYIVVKQSDIVAVIED